MKLATEPTSFSDAGLPLPLVVSSLPLAAPRPRIVFGGASPNERNNTERRITEYIFVSSVLPPTEKLALDAPVLPPPLPASPSFWRDEINEETFPSRAAPLLSPFASDFDDDDEKGNFKRRPQDILAVLPICYFFPCKTNSSGPPSVPRIFRIVTLYCVVVLTWRCDHWWWWLFNIHSIF